MRKERLEAFTDGVLAIAITIMVLDLKVPSGPTFSALRLSIPVLLAYALSFANVGIFWNNHHHMLHVTERINGMVLWANLACCSGCRLCRLRSDGWMTLISLRRPPPLTASCWECPRSLTSGWNEPSSRAMDPLPSWLAPWATICKKQSFTIFVWTRHSVGVCAPWIALTIYVLNAAMWFIPDRRIESIV